MSGKPSEGPFEIMEGQDHVEVVASDGRTVAVFWAGALDMSAEEALANARLFIAAPKLLSIVSRFIALPGGAWHPERHAADEMELMEQARAALKEAGGE